MRKRMPYNNNMRNMNPGGGGGGGGGNRGGRGGNQQRRGSSGGQRHYDDGDQVNPRQRKHVMNMHEKYTNQGRDALRSGDRVLAEYWFQHAEHYARVLNAINELFAPEPGQQGGQDGDDDGNHMDSSAAGAEGEAPQQDRYQRPRYQGGQNENRDRQPRQHQEGRGERQGGDQPRGERQERPEGQARRQRQFEPRHPAPTDQGSALADILPAPASYESPAPKPTEEKAAEAPSFPSSSDQE